MIEPAVPSTRNSLTMKDAKYAKTQMKPFHVFHVFLGLTCLSPIELGNALSPEHAVDLCRCGAAGDCVFVVLLVAGGDSRDRHLGARGVVSGQPVDRPLFWSAGGFGHGLVACSATSSARC